MIENNNISILIRQIAGALARRIITYGKLKENVKTCDELGFIKFGSRVDLFLPINTKLNIPTKDIFFISAATGKGTNKLLKSLETEVLYNKSD